LGFEKAILFGNSFGGILGCQVAIECPDVVEHLICHEAPTFQLLDDATERYDRILKLVEIYKKTGLAAAFTEFRKIFVGFNDLLFHLLSR